MFSLLQYHRDNAIPSQTIASSKPKPKSRSNPKKSDSSHLEDRLKSHYVVINCVGKGSVGTVFQGMDRSANRLHAIKVIRKSDVMSSTAKSSMQNELTALQTLRHKYIMRFHYSHEDDDYIYIATEFCSKGDLLSLMRKSSVGLSARRAISIMRQVFLALRYMHDRGVSHRDVKLQNVLMATDGSIRLADFGLVHFNEPDKENALSKRVCGTPDYSAPEIIAGLPYIPQLADMWACGITLYVLLTRRKPFNVSSWRRAKYARIVDDVKSALSDDCLKDVGTPCKTLLRGLLSVNPSDRLSTANAISICEDALVPGRKSLKPK